MPSIQAKRLECLVRLNSLILVAMVVISSIGCISAPVKEAHSSTLRIGYQPSTHQVAEMVAREMGWWMQDLKPFGVTDIKEFEFSSGPPEAHAMMAGDLDIAYIGTSPLVFAISNGLDAKIVAGVNVNGSDLILRTGLPYNGPSSLEGMTIGTFPPGSVQDMVLSKWLSDSGVDPSKVSVRYMGPGDGVAAMFSGRVDGVFLPAPSASLLELDGSGRKVISSGQMWPGHACCSLAVSGKLIREKPDLVAQIVRTHINATYYVNSHQEAAAEIYANATGQDLEMVRRSMDEWGGSWTSDPALQAASTMDYARMGFDLNYTSIRMKDSDIFDDKFYHRAVL